MNKLAKSAEEYMCQTQKLFDDEMYTMWQNQKDPSSKQKLDSSLLNIIDQRLINITEQMQCLYKYKIHHYFSQTSKPKHKYI